MILQGLQRLKKYFDKSLDDEILELYVAALDRYSVEQIRELFKKILARCRYFPRIAEIEELMGAAGGKQPAALTSRAYEAFEEAVSTMRKVGSYRTPEFTDPLIPAVIKNRFNGWIRFGQIEVNDWTRKAFVEEYRALSEAEEVPSIALEGMHQRKQLSSGMKQIGNFIGENNGD